MAANKSALQFHVWKNLSTANEVPEIEVRATAFFTILRSIIFRIAMAESVLGFHGRDAAALVKALISAVLVASTDEKRKRAESCEERSERAYPHHVHDGHTVG